MGVAKTRCLEAAAIAAISVMVASCSSTTTSPDAGTTLTGGPAWNYIGVS